MEDWKLEKAKSLLENRNICRNGVKKIQAVLDNPGAWSGWQMWLNMGNAEVTVSPTDFIVFLKDQQAKYQLLEKDFQKQFDEL